MCFLQLYWLYEIIIVYKYIYNYKIMAEIPNIDNLIDYSKKDIIKTTKDSQELVTQYDWKINEESLKKLWETLNLNQNQIAEVRLQLKKIIVEVKNNFQNPYMDKKSKNIEARYDDLMASFNNLNTVAARQISELLWLDANSIWNTLNNNIINARNLPDIKYGVEKNTWKPDVAVTKPDNNINTASISKNPYPANTMMWNQWEKVNAGK